MDAKLTVINIKQADVKCCECNRVLLSGVGPVLIRVGLFGCFSATRIVERFSAECTCFFGQNLCHGVTDNLMVVRL